jgi:hypothetical protein
MDYLHLSTSDVANLKESWVVLEDNISKVKKELIVLGSPVGQHIQGKKRSRSPAWVVLEDNISTVR